MNVREWALPVYTILMQLAVGTLLRPGPSRESAPEERAAPLLEAEVASGKEPFLVIGALAGG